MNIHPIVSGLLTQQIVNLVVKDSASGEFLTNLHAITSNQDLRTEEGRIAAMNQSLNGVIVASMGFDDDDDYYQTSMYRVKSGVAYIPVHGALINRFNGSWFGLITGYDYIKAAVKQAVSDENVSKIVLDVNSYGGEAAGCFETSQYIREMADKKPITAVVNTNCYSGGYALASAAREIIAVPSAGIGSIGVVSMHVSYEKYLESLGLKTTFIQAGDKKTLGNPYQDLTEESKDDIQKRVNVLYEGFIKLVADNRGIDVADVIKTQAACYTSKEALEIGLIDKILTVEQAVEFLTKKDENIMTIDAKQPSTTQEQPETGVNAATAERTRIGAILGCEAAKSSSQLANHLAFNTNVSAEEATAILTAAKADVEAAADKAKAEVSVETTAKVEESNPLAQAMAVSGSPNVGADAAVVTGTIDVQSLAKAVNQ